MVSSHSASKNAMMETKITTMDVVVRAKLNMVGPAPQVHMYSPTTLSQSVKLYVEMEYVFSLNKEELKHVILKASQDAMEFHAKFLMDILAAVKLIYQRVIYLFFNRNS